MKRRIVAMIDGDQPNYQILIPSFICVFNVHLRLNFLM